MTILARVLAADSPPPRVADPQPPQEVTNSAFHARDVRSFASWAEGSSIPTCPLTGSSLAAVGNLIGEAKIVALGEGMHLAREPLEFRNELFKYLVAEKGFTAIALESGLTEGRTVYEYVRGGAGTLDSVLAQGIGWTFDRLPQNRALVSWLRAYNADSHHTRKLNFYGFDIPGSPGETEANRGPNTALTEALRYLATVDAKAAGEFRARLDRVLPRLGFDLGPKGAQSGYATLGKSQRDALSATIADLVALFERREHPYIARSSLSDYEWAYRSAVGARQVDYWLRQFPVHYRPIGAETQKLFSGGDARDRAMVDNLEWIVNQEGSAGKVLIFAHSVHLSADSASFSWWPTAASAKPASGQRGRYAQQVAGTYLRQRFGERLVIVGNVVGHGSVGYSGYEQSLGAATLGSFAELAKGDNSNPCYLLDLRSAPSDVKSLLNENRSLGHGEEAFGLSTDVAVRLAHAYDLLYYVDTVTPAAQAH
jgi:erythromycin esterase